MASSTGPGMLDHGSIRARSLERNWYAARAAHRLAFVMTGAILLAGCHAFTLPDRQSVPADRISYSARRPVVVEEPLAAARGRFDAAKAAESQQQEQCVDLYFQAAVLAWQPLEFGDQAALPIYRESLSHMLAAANRYGRLDPRGRLTIATAQGRQAVPITYYGFAWKPSDFCQVLPAADFDHDGLRHYYYTPGIGTSLVAVRQASHEEEFFSPRQTFPVAAVLRPTASGEVLEFYNPLMFDSLAVDPGTLPLDRDLTASLVYLKETAPQKYLQGFLDPGETDVKPKLVMLEPYQRGKIPVVFIHGLGSDPLTWIDATNNLRAQGDIYRRCQFWYFRYPTGGDPLESAADLRDKLLLRARPATRGTAIRRLRKWCLSDTAWAGSSRNCRSIIPTTSSGGMWQESRSKPFELRPGFAKSWSENSSSIRRRWSGEWYSWPRRITARTWPDDSSVAWPRSSSATRLVKRPPIAS